MHRVFSASAAPLALLCAAAAAAPLAPAAAQIAPGSTLVFTGSADALDLGTPGVRLDFAPDIVASTTDNTGTFERLNRHNGGGVGGTAQPFVVGQGPQRIRNFFVLGGYRFTLDSLPSGRFGQADCYVAAMPGQTCTPYQSALGEPRPGVDKLSPFYLANLAFADPNVVDATLVQFDLFGTVTGPGGATSPFLGVISTLLPGSYQQVLGGLEQAGGAGLPLPGVPFTGTFVTGDLATLAASRGGTLAQVTTTPEPSGVALVAAGLGAVGAAARRRRRAARGA